MENVNYGNGNGSGYGSGSGDGDGNGSGYGSGYGYGNGYGNGYGDGDGYGDGSILELSEAAAWSAYHYLATTGARMQLRSGATVAIGEHLHEDIISLCRCGLHASLSRHDAAKYQPAGSILTQVRVWGRVIVGHDKLVATDRKIIAVLDRGSR